MIERFSQESEFHHLLDPPIYLIKNSDVVLELGEGHPLVERLAGLEAGATHQAIRPPRAD